MFPLGIAKGCNLTVDDTQWADESISVVKEQGANASAVSKYSASKTLAEKAAWEFYDEHKSEIQWDLVAQHPPLLVHLSKN